MYARICESIVCLKRPGRILHTFSTLAWSVIALSVSAAAYAHSDDEPLSPENMAWAWGAFIACSLCLALSVGYTVRQHKLASGRPREKYPLPLWLVRLLRLDRPSGRRGTMRKTGRRRCPSLEVRYKNPEAAESARAADRGDAP